MFMDERTFDRIARLFAARRGRREVAAALGALVAGAPALPAVAQVGAENPGTARCGTKGDPCGSSKDCCSGYKCNKKKGKCKSDGGSTCKVEGDRCSTDRDCCSDLICDSRGRCNQGESRVTFVRKWGEFGFADGQFDTPSGIGLDTDDGGVTVYVADTLNDRVQKFDSDGLFLTKFGDTGSGDQLLNEPHGVAVNAYSGDIYVADTAANKIKMWKNSGIATVTYDRSYGSRGSSTGRCPPGRTGSRHLSIGNPTRER